MEVICDFIRSAANDDRVACIVPTLRSGANVNRGAENIDQFALPFIARYQDPGISIDSSRIDEKEYAKLIDICFKQWQDVELQIWHGGVILRREVRTHPHWAPTTMVIVMVSSSQIN